MFDEGRIAEVGSYDSLVNNGGRVLRTCAFGRERLSAGGKRHAWPLDVLWPHRDQKQIVSAAIEFLPHRTARNGGPLRPTGKAAGKAFLPATRVSAKVPHVGRTKLKILCA